MGKNTVNATIKVTFRHTESTQALRSYVEDKVMPLLEKYCYNDVHADVTLSVEKDVHTAEVRVSVKGPDLFAKISTEDLYTSIDGMVNSLQSQLRKFKEKVVDHHRDEAREFLR